MEKGPAASAMEWSIHLEKSLRSKTQGKSIEALEEIGRRLDCWNRESELSSAEYRMFDLIPGEEKLFLNAILLRLADAFRSGNYQVQSGVVLLFSRIKGRRKRDGGVILNKGKLENHLELLSRVKEVFDKGDVEERTLALLLFGLWAPFAQDCEDVRYSVLSSLVAGEAREVKAALFAAGCFSDLSDDFANVFLEILTNMVLSIGISSDIKLAGAKAFSKLLCPFSVADKAYKTGLKLLTDSSDNHFSALMLISLSRIASRWMLLIPTQIELLSSFQSEEKSLSMQATSLRCYHIIFSRGVCNFPLTTDTVNKLFGILQRCELQPTLQLEALRVLHKILTFNLFIITSSEISGFFLKLLEVVKNVLQSPNISNRVLAASVLTDLSGKFLERVDMVSDGTGCTLASQVISFVLDHILCLLTPIASHLADFDADLEVKSLLNTLCNLVEIHSYLRDLVLHNICIFIDKLMKMLDAVKDTKISDLSNAKIPFESNLMLNVSKIIAACLQRLEETNTETSRVLDALKLQLQNVCHCSYFGSYISMTYFLVLHLLSTFVCARHATEELVSQSRKSSSCFVDSIIESDKLTLDCAIKMLGRNNYWYLYKAGKKAACQGAWSASAFIFEKLIAVVRSPSYTCWLKSLAKFSTAEKQIQLYRLTYESTLGQGGDIASSTNYCNFKENILQARNTLLSAKEILVASDMGHPFSFQRWFLTLRADTLKIVADMIKLLDTKTLDMEVSCQMNKLAREFDLLLMSFMGMDKYSVKCVSALALSCSLMAFTAGFVFLVPNLLSSGTNGISEFGKSEESLFALLIEDLFGRLNHLDCKTKKNLLLLKSLHKYKDSFSRRLQYQITCSSNEAVVLRRLTEYSVGEIFRLQNEANDAQDSDAVARVLNNGSQLLWNVISKLMLIPFNTPHHFFRVRPAVSSEIIVVNEDGQTTHGSSISSGSHLSLNLNLQLKNIPAGPLGRPKKAYCILSCKAHSLKTTKIGECEGQEAQSSSEGRRDTDDLLDQNEKLLRYVVGSVQTCGFHRAGPSDHLTVTEYVCFELNERGHGFSTCLLDVSFLPVGSYRIDWHSGCVDSEGSYWSILPASSGPLFTIGGAAIAP